MGMPRCVPSENKDGSQLGPTWECPSGSAQVCPMWARQTKCSGSLLGSPHGTNVGNPTFKLRHGTHLGVKWVLVKKHVGPNWDPLVSHMGKPTWAPCGPPRTKRSGSHLGCPSGTYLAAHLGPKWGPCGIPVGVCPEVDNVTGILPTPTHFRWVVNTRFDMTINLCVQIRHPYLEVTLG